MRALTGAARAICYATAIALDRSERGKDEAARKAAHERASLLTPIAKAFSTDIGIEVASLGVQVHGGMGFIEETGAAQHFSRRADRGDLRRHQRHPGDRSRHPQAAALRRRGGRGAISSELRGIVEAVNATNDPAFGWTGVRLGEAVESLTRATAWMLGRSSTRIRRSARRRDALSAAVRPGHRRLPVGERGARGAADRRRTPAAHRAGAVLRRELRGPGRRAGTHRGRRRAGPPRRRRRAGVAGPGCGAARSEAERAPLIRTVTAESAHLSVHRFALRSARTAQ